MISAEWPPPKIKELVIEELYSEENPEILEALWPSPEEIDQQTRALGRLLLEHANGRPLKELYPIPIISSRGGLHTANLLIRPFGYTNQDIRFLGLSSYQDGGTQQSEGFLYGHMPLRVDIEGQNVLTIDEVCDTGRTQLENERIIMEELGAASVTSAVLDYKPERSKKTGFVPDFYVATTERWIVYPWEPYEILGERALDDNLWLPGSSETGST